MGIIKEMEERIVECQTMNLKRNSKCNFNVPLDNFLIVFLYQNLDNMNEVAQKLVLTVPSSQMAGFLEALRQFDFIKIESLEEIIRRYVQNAPKQALLSDEDINDILMEVRYKRPSDIAG